MMGRLFWKFFAIFILAQLVVAAGVGFTLWSSYQEHLDTHFDSLVQAKPGSMVHDLIHQTAVKLQDGGIESLHAWYRNSDSPSAVFALDDNNREVFGRPVPKGIINLVHQIDTSDRVNHQVFRINLANGDRYRLFVPNFGRPLSHLEGYIDPPQERMLITEPVVIGTLLVGLAVSAFLACHLSRPIQKLRVAVNAAAHGNLEVHPGTEMGQRKDELAELGRDFDYMVKRLRALVENQNRLLHDVSHEMRSPLARQQVALDLMRQQPEKQEMCMTRIENELRRMDLLIGELLALSQIEAKDDLVQIEHVNLASLLEEIVDDARFEVKTSDKHITLNTPESVMVYGRADLLHRALENVVRNATKHTLSGNNGVEVTVEVERRGDSSIFVCDHGQGVPEDEIESIFEPFYRGDTTNESGYGLGLAIARRVIEAHGGSIRAINRPDCGLCINIRLPENAKFSALTEEESL